MAPNKILFVLSICLAAANNGLLSVAAADDLAEFVPGQTVKKVVKLTQTNFRTAINDPANPVWFLKFYAYWCGHCKKMAPVLDKAAPQVAGKMAIGKIDCTEEKKLCDEFKVRGYPTLKFSLDGEIHEYPLGRTEKEIVRFGEKMSRPAMKLVDSVNEAMDFTKEGTFGHGVSYVCYDPKATTGSIEEMIEFSPLLQVCAQTARQQMAHGYFTALKADADVGTLALKPPSNEEDEAPKTAGGFLCRLEDRFAPRCLYQEETKIDSDTAHDFVQASNVETVTELGPGNFHRIGRLGRKLLIGVANIDDKDMVDEVKAALANFAQTGPSKMIKKHYFGWMDGKKWCKYFLFLFVQGFGKSRFFKLRFFFLFFFYKQSQVF